MSAQLTLAQKPFRFVLAPGSKHAQSVLGMLVSRHSWGARIRLAGSSITVCCSWAWLQAPA